ncbi:MAG: tetratricopeptide repeat protein [Acidobacteriia bacterium]|nr:tetratricopeptide repeat protein [Terriglobia bacterium]
MIVLLTLLAYRGVLGNGFVNYDDDRYVTANAQVQKGLTADSIAWAFTATECSNWHPLTWLSHMLDVQLFGLDAGRHHLVSLLLHAANALLLFLLLVRLTGSLWRCAFVACLFAVHPLHVESVAWIAERKDVLSTLFGLLALLAWVGYLGSRTALRYALVVALYALSLMAKPMLVTLPFLLLLLDFWPLRRLALPLRESKETLSRLLVEKAPLLAMAAASCVVTFAAQRSGGSVETLQDFTFGERLANAALSYVSYLGKTFWPASLAVFYPHPHGGLTPWPLSGSIVLLAAFTWLSLRLAKKAPYVAFGWLWYLGALVPVVGFVQVGAQAMADRYTYVPLIGIFVAIAWALTELGASARWARTAVAAASAAALLALSIVTRVQVGRWTDDVALFDHALAVTSDNWLAETNLGVAVFDRGRTDEAIAHYSEALRIWPGFAEAHNDLGLALVRKGRIAEAIEHYHEALRLYPEFAEAYNDLGTALARQGRTAEAVEQLDRALRLRPGSAGFRFNMGNALLGAGRFPQAIEQFDRALVLEPDYAEASNGAGLALTRMNRWPEAADRFRQALAIRADLAEAHNNLGIALAREGRYPEAIEHFRRALAIKPDFAEAGANILRAEGAIGGRP